MEVSASQLRARLSYSIDRARNGEDVLVTQRGIPVARLTRIDSSSTIDQLTREGVISPPRSPGPRPSAADSDRVTAARDIAELVSEQRR